MDRQVGRRYRLIEPLGEGGMGIVWRAHDEFLDRPVAVKEVRYTGVGEAKRAELNARTIREARAAGRLDHPGVVVVHDVVEEDGRPWIVMQLVPSRSLAEVVRSGGPLPVGHVAHIGLQVLGALRAAHATGVLHRDVKPENVLLADDGRVVLTDFGIATLEADAGLTATGNLVGTPAYMPPERLNGLPATPASDLWSLGATLYAAAEGVPPFRRDSWAATVAAVLRDAPEPPRLAGPLAPVIMGLLKGDPATRMGADEVQARLTALRSGTAPQRLGEATVDLPAPRRRPAALWAVPLVLLLAAGAGGGYWWVSSQSAAGAPVTASPTPAPPTSAPATPTRTAKPTPSLPAGWRTVKNAAGGFSIALPAGWTIKPHATRASVTLSGPGAQGVLIVEWTEPEADYADEVEHWTDVERQILAKNQFTGYRRIGIRPLTYLGRPAADWEFIRSVQGRQLHVVNRGFRTRDGRPFALYWEAPQSTWNAELRYLRTFRQSFRPS
ncbi:protein kinase [Nonomuraea sp. NPDC050328]|uniref:serine/threonine-protein kinase n=1 Tax=Nonomuraea sp. NPDC050328 TaxID=3364361 RepID=UPI00378ACB62